MPYRIVSRVTHRGPGVVHVKAYVKLNKPRTPEDDQKVIDNVERQRKQEPEEEKEDA